MARAQYFVVLRNGEWKIKHQDVHYGPYGTQRKAVRVAVDTAHKAGGNGFDAQVLVQGQNHQFRIEWTYGHDPYPPRGWRKGYI
jgi:hypothetical protein